VVAVNYSVSGERKGGQATFGKAASPLLSGKIQNQQLDVGRFFDGIAEAILMNPDNPGIHFISFRIVFSFSCSL
jgi:hypothetical protein